MNDSFIRNRLTYLRLKKGVSEYKMSTDLGHSKSYIQSIASGRSLPSFTEFLYICDYLDITPELFFKEEITEPALINQIINSLSGLRENDLQLLLELINRFNESV